MAHYRRFYDDSTTDTKIAGLYDLGPTIGKGHYAVVKLASHVFTGEKVAVKVIDKTKLDPVSREHLFQEVVCMKLVQHPNVVRLYEVIDTLNKLYLVLELGDGGDLYDYIMKHEHGLSETLAKRYFRQIVTAISYCHNLHVVHRDLKPENVVFFEQLGVVKLTDFGFSNQFVPGKYLETACGSLAYSAPEILLGNSYDAPKVDIWSLGVILYMLVCGRLPFEEANDSETLTKIMDCEYQLPVHLSLECCSLISRLLIRDPSKRAQLDEILLDDWLRLEDKELPIDLFSMPLISQEHLSFEDHMEILNKMASGGLAGVDEIQGALDRSEYSHISATYFLLAERKLKRNYIEEYKLLSAQAKLIEQTYVHRNQTPLPEPRSFVLQPASAVLPKSISASLAASGAEERLRRFSMILEDEEEAAAAEEESRLNPVEEFVLLESSDDDEVEELEAVASLACVRSELMDHQEVGDIRGLSLETDCAFRLFPCYTRTNSRVGTPLIDLSERAGSELSLRGGQSVEVCSSFRKPAVSSCSLAIPRHHRRPLRPLVSVKSSPQLLKYIAEENWEGSLDAEHSPLRSNEYNSTEQKQSECVPKVNGYNQEHVGLVTNVKIASTKKSASTMFAKGAISSIPRARSPPWNRKFQSMSNASVSGCSSRPMSGINWGGAVSPTQFPMVAERKRRASVSSSLSLLISPNAVNVFMASRHTPNNSFYVRSSAMLRNRDRRRSGPPGFVCGLPAEIAVFNTNNTHLNFVRASLNLGSSRSSSEASERDPNCGVEFVASLTHRVPMSALKESSTAATPSINEPSLHRRFRVSCQSAPSILDNMFTLPAINLSGGSKSPPRMSAIDFPTCIVPNQPTINPQPPIREVCTPIREEEDECRGLSPTGTKNSGAQSPIIPIEATRFSELKSLSSPRGSLQHPLEASLQSKSVLRLSRFRNLKLNGTSPQLTASNFSLTSLAGSLRDSSHMMDIIRGAFELHMHSKRRGPPRVPTGASFDSSTGTDLTYGRISAVPTNLSMVRSLTLIHHPTVGPLSSSANASLRSSRNFRMVPVNGLRQSSTSPQTENPVNDRFFLGGSIASEYTSGAVPSSVTGKCFPSPRNSYVVDYVDGYASNESIPAKHNYQPSVCSLPNPAAKTCDSSQTDASTGRGCVIEGVPVEEFGEENSHANNCYSTMASQESCQKLITKEHTFTYSIRVLQNTNSDTGGTTPGQNSRRRKLKKFRIFPCRSKLKPIVLGSNPYGRINLASPTVGNTNGSSAAVSIAAHVPNEIRSNFGGTTVCMEPRKISSCCRIS